MEGLGDARNEHLLTGGEAIGRAGECCDIARESYTGDTFPDRTAVGICGTRDATAGALIAGGNHHDHALCFKLVHHEVGVLQLNTVELCCVVTERDDAAAGWVGRALGDSAKNPRRITREGEPAGRSGGHEHPVETLISR
ncbi:unannotated protein [freshwater metagenome]|uniref:Unannotated protein n=1 Tax=freshwater metagenome TaxID=449393 RepID=A0A6J6MQR7_9ZZZZ